jgi:molybdopterin converting factor small subunit
MSITIELPSALQPYARGESAVRLAEPCATVSQALTMLGARCPGVVDRVLTEQGEIRPHVNIFVGSWSVRFAGGLAAPVADGDTITIVPAVSGG